MPRKSPYVIALTNRERAELEARSRDYTLPYREVVRAKIVLMASEGHGNDRVAARLDMPRQIVSKWGRRFYTQRLRVLPRPVISCATDTDLHLNLTKEDLRAILDLSPREVARFVPLILITLWMGIYPTSFSGIWDGSVAAMVQQHTAALDPTTKVANSQSSWSGLTRPSTTLQPATSENVDSRPKPGHDEGGARL